MFKIITVLFTILVLQCNAFAQVRLVDLQEVILAFQQEYGPELARQNATLSINNPPPGSDLNYWWNLNTVRSSYSQYQDDAGTHHLLFMMGGYARLPGMTTDGLIATLCHELGHGIGGGPYKEDQNSLFISGEGQADYFAYRSCFPRLVNRIKPSQALSPLNDLTDKWCRDAQAISNINYSICHRAIQELEVEKMYLSLDGSSKTSFETQDESVTPKIETRADFYPAPQCRLDTMIAGVLNKPRPTCWYKK